MIRYLLIGAAAALLVAVAIGPGSADVKFGGNKAGGFGSKVPGVIPTPVLPAADCLLVDTGDCLLVDVGDKLLVQ